jgi:hypothetical protein
MHCVWRELIGQDAFAERNGSSLTYGLGGPLA